MNTDEKRHEAYAWWNELSNDTKNALIAKRLNQIKDYSKLSGHEVILIWEEETVQNENSLVRKYKERLEILKENRAINVDFNTDAENDRIDGEINMVTEFIRDLKECGVTDTVIVPKSILIVEVRKQCKFGEDKSWFRTTFTSFDRDKLKDKIESHYKLKLIKDDNDDFPWFSDGGFIYNTENENFKFEIVAFPYDIV